MAAPVSLRRAVVGKLGEMFPLVLAEAWDNVGLLLEPEGPQAESSNVVLLTNDLTEAVLDEAVAAGAGLVVTYHPRPFSGLKRLTQADVTQRIVLRCVERGIWVYSPHTACDNAAGGVNDWLADAVADVAAGDLVAPVVALEGPGTTGRGRIVTLAEPLQLGQVVDKVKAHLRVEHLRMAPAARLVSGVEDASTGSACMEAASDSLVRTVAVQAGSGHSVLAGVRADVVVTGEMGHHEALEMSARGTTVLLAEHSNSERVFLHTLCARLSRDFPNARFQVSRRDCDPLRTV